MLLCLSASHRTAAFDLLERLSVGATDLGTELVEASPSIEGAVVLATCNRFEAYLDVDGSARADESERALRRVAELTGVDGDRLREAVVVHSDAAVAEHLFAVSSGLESVVVGEGEIAGQVRRALERARAQGTTSTHLERLFQRASTASREVQNTTGLGGAGRSIVRLALDLASSRIADWRDQDVLLVGTGAYAGASLAALRDRGVGEVAVYSPSGRASRFATREGVRPIRDLRSALETATVVVTCSGASTYVLTPELVAARQATGPLFVIDLGLPRNVDPRVGELPGVELLDLETIRLHAPLSELAAPDEARDLVGRAAAQFTAESSEHQVTSAVVAFRTHVFGILEAELARLGERGLRDQTTERALRHLVSVLVHQPTQRAKDLARAGQGERVVDALNTLFDLGTGLDEEERGRASEAG
ncbi:glutamyl-tRNA reductase [Naasia sp. SYSU D00948]|uniref:glutamyl-tRNA reductase n=1 Tax=Naasia sp. SYSU D00948 TaxID=2817379 RepID=UPI001B3024E6|nr:glutamyl-tRNA reductase [Naasia sp. SYSU D00948]